MRVYWYYIFFFVWISIIELTASDSVALGCLRTSKPSANKNAYKTYQYFAEQVNWIEAMISCKSRCMDLASLDSRKGENAAIKEIKKYTNSANKSTWIGLLFDRNKFFNMNWQEIFPGQLPYSNIAKSSRHRVSDAGCFALTSNWRVGEYQKWFGHNCLKKKSYLCQRITPK